MEKALLNLGGKEYEIRFTIGFWKEMKKIDVNSGNLESRLQEDFGNVAPKVILAGIVGAEKPSIEEIESSLDRSVMDVFEQAAINGMTKAEKEILEIAKKRRSETLAGIAAQGNDDSGKK